MSATPPFSGPLESLVGELLNTLTNAGLGLDPLTQSRLRALEGRSIQLVARLPAPFGDGAQGAENHKTFTLVVTGGRLQILTYAQPRPNAIVRGTLPDLLAWSVRGAGAGNVSFEGDETVLQELTGIVQGYKPDLSEPMTGLLGSKAADNLLNIAEGAMATLRSAVEGAGAALQRGTAERFVTRPQLDAFLDILDDARSRTDRLAQRVEAVEARAAAGESDRREES